MKTDHKKKDSEILGLPVAEKRDLESTELPPEETPLPRPTIWRTVGRLLHETIFIVFFIGLHWVIKWWLAKTNQQHEWWAQYLLLVSIFYAIVAFTVIFGSELIVDCKRAIDLVWKQIRKKP